MHGSVTVLNEMFAMQYFCVTLRAMMQFIAIVNDQYARLTHFPDDDKVTYRYGYPCGNQV